MKQSNGFIQEPMATEEVDNVQVKKEISSEINNVPIGQSSEISLAIKPKTGLPLFKQRDIYKSRLKVCLFLHFLLFLVMMAKLSEDILDRFGIFLLQLEELYIPKPLPFEYGWTVTIIFNFVAMRALSRNLGSLKTYAAGTVVFGICPLLGAAIYFFNDVLEYAEKKDEANVEKWRDFPVALWWYAFILIALQVHIFSLFFAAKLLKIWRSKAKKF